MFVKKMCVYAALMGMIFALGIYSAHADCYECMSCAELIQLAKQSQQDLRAIKTVLRSAIAVGNVEMVRSYKLDKGSVKKRAQRIMNALESKGCLAH
jgi:hypothetical protein